MKNWVDNRDSAYYLLQEFVTDTDEVFIQVCDCFMSDKRWDIIVNDMKINDDLYNNFSNAYFGLLQASFGVDYIKNNHDNILKQINDFFDEELKNIKTVIK